MRRPGISFTSTLLTLLIVPLSSLAAETRTMEASTLELPPTTAAERALVEVPGHPGAPAVILTKRAELRLGDGGTPSSFAVAVRLKVLTEAGKAYGQVTVGHGDAIRMERFAGVTTTPDGERVPLPADAVFQERRGARRVTKAAFPAVEVGAIVDYGYRLTWDTGSFYEPWYLDDRLPTLYSELIYHERRGRRLGHRARDPDERLRVEVEEREDGRIVRVVGEHLPAVVEEPHGFAFVDLAHRVLITAGENGGWGELCARIEEGVYAPARRFDRDARARARELVRGLREPEQRIDALYRFVRDGVRVERGSGVLPTPDVTVDRVLEAGRGTAADAALLLQSMLAAAKIPARLVWAVDWRDGESDLAVPNPGFFDRVLVAAGPRHAPTYLDPGERGLAAGRLTPLQEGTKALICDEPPAVVELPRTPAAGSLRRAVLDLALDDDGRVHGRGALELTGHHAWYLLRRREGPEATAAGWRRWLEERLPGHEVADVAVDEGVDEQHIDVAWSMAQRSADVLGDETSLDPSRPLGPVEQRYTIPPTRRRTPVRVSFADRDELELRLVWPAGWSVELAPASRRHESVAGGFETRLERDDEARRLVYRRGFEIAGVVFPPGEPYAALRELYAELERHDAQSLVLVLE